MAKRHCPQCGAKIGETAAFCIFCGAQLEPEQVAGPSGTGPIGAAPAGRWSAASQQTPHQAIPQQAPRQTAPPQAQHQTTPPPPVYATQRMPQSQSVYQPQQKRSKAPLGIIIGACVVIIVILAVVVAFFVLPMLDSKPSASKASVSAASSASTSVTGATPPIFPNVTVSSQLPGDADTADYGASNLTDDKRETAWNEGAPGAGEGEWVKFSANTPQRVTSVSIMGGFPKLYKDGSDVYQKNPRPREITISYDGGSQKFTMQDSRGEFQTFTLSKPVDTTWVTITIDSVYPGSKYDDCCIAEVKFQ